MYSLSAYFFFLFIRMKSIIIIINVHVHWRWLKTMNYYRYHTSTFGYDIPVSQDGPYVLVLKFCEVYFDAPGQKVLDQNSISSLYSIYSFKITSKHSYMLALDLSQQVENSFPQKTICIEVARMSELPHSRIRRMIANDYEQLKEWAGVCSRIRKIRGIFIKKSINRKQWGICKLVEFPECVTVGGISNMLSSKWMSHIESCWRKKP